VVVGLCTKYVATTGKIETLTVKIKSSIFDAITNMAKGVLVA